MPRLFSRRRVGPRVFLRVSVTEDDIVEAVRRDSGRNPIALAMARQLNVARVRVTRTGATLVWNSPQRDVEVVRLPLVARFFMICFEAPTPVPVSPFTFRLAVTAVQWQKVSESDLGLPAGAREAATYIGERAQALLGRADEFRMGSKDLFIVKQVLETYLPETLADYVALNEEQRSQPLSPDGRTGRQVLVHELELIAAKLDEITAELERARAAKVLVQERFLAEQLGESPPGGSTGEPE